LPTCWLEESAAAADSLKAQARELVDVLAVFKLVGDSSTNVARAAVQIKAPIKVVKADFSPKA
jgi:hypothetical protein